MVKEDALSLGEQIAVERELHNKIEILVPKFEGWCSVEKAKWLVSWILRKKPKLVVEIGVFAGRSLIPIGLALKSVQAFIDDGKAIAYGIDPYTKEAALEGQQPDENEKWWKTIDLAKIKALALKAIDETNLGDVVTLLDISAEEAAGLIDDGTVDLLHVDGNHSEISSCRDVNIWFCKVTPGGIIVLDDTDWPTVQAARKILNERCKKVCHATTWEVFQKPVN
jgi:predicted O-methyltransferase YrrM